MLVIGRDLQPYGPRRWLCGASRLLRLSSRYVSDKRDRRAIPCTSEEKPRGVVQPRLMNCVQAHPVRGFVSIFGSKGGEKVASSKNPAGEWTY